MASGATKLAYEGIAEQLRRLILSSRLGGPRAPAGRHTGEALRRETQDGVHRHFAHSHRGPSCARRVASGVEVRSTTSRIPRPRSRSATHPRCSPTRRRSLSTRPAGTTAVRGFPHAARRRVSECPSPARKSQRSYWRHVHDMTENSDVGHLPPHRSRCHMRTFEQSRSATLIRLANASALFGHLADAEERRAKSAKR